MENGASSITLYSYLSSGHFIQSTFENWESEFLQMVLFVVLTISLQQKGSSESKDFDKQEEVDKEEPDPEKKYTPWPIKSGGWVLGLYEYSLIAVLVLLFLLSFGAHFYESLKDENEKLTLKGFPLEIAAEYIIDTRFWFESFQNWQSEFLSVLTIVLL